MVGRAPSPDRLVITTVVGLLVAAVVTELRKPPRRRRWRGELLGVLPYDLRAPWPRRLLAGWWQPRNRAWLLPQPFGFGWVLNLGRLWRAVQR